MKLKERKNDRIMNKFRKAISRRYRILGDNEAEEVEEE